MSDAVAAPKSLLSASLAMRLMGAVLAAALLWAAVGWAL